MPTRWVLVAGTGLENGLTTKIVWLAEAIGSILASDGYGLVSGGWHGVDFVTAQAFAGTLATSRPAIPLGDVLLQVVPRGTKPVFQGGRTVSVDPGPAEWVEALRFADAAVLIGGIGGTYRTYAHAMQERRAVFPVADSEGDAATVFSEMRQRWHAAGIWGISRTSFETVLSREVRSQIDARRLVQDLMLLVRDHFAFGDKELQRNKLFISYAREDRDWLAAARTRLRAIPSVTAWDDSDIPTGADFEREIQQALAASKASLLLVTPDFLASTYIRQHELPYLARAVNTGLITMFWIHVRHALYEQCELAAIQAAHDVGRPLESMPPSEQQEMLAGICLRVAQFMRDVPVMRTALDADS